jgi:hypothetical protein
MKNWSWIKMPPENEHNPNWPMPMLVTRFLNSLNDDEAASAKILSFRPPLPALGAHATLAELLEAIPRMHDAHDQVFVVYLKDFDRR